MLQITRVLCRFHGATTSGTQPDTRSHAIEEKARTLPGATHAERIGAHGESARRATFISMVLPCLNEEAAVGATVREALEGLARAGAAGEVLVVDNGSIDRSVEEAEAAGARVVREPRRGYGAAHLAGIAAARGDVIVMADADQTYDLENLGLLVRGLEAGADMVIANRLAGAAEPGAMPSLHRRVGTPAITRIISLATGARVRDSQSGYRAFWRDKAQALNLRTPGMEYASELLLRAAHAGWTIDEIPSTYRKRVGESKLNTLGDGWRHLRYLLVTSPHLSLIYPGATALMLGLVICGMSIVSPHGVGLGSYRFLPVFLGPTLLVVGMQALSLGAIAAARSPLTPPRIKRRLGFLQGPGALNRTLGYCAGLAAMGVALNGLLFVLWIAGASGWSLLGLAGIAQAAVISGLGGIAAALAADFASESLGD